MVVGADYAARPAGENGITFPKAVRDREVPFVAPQALGATLSVRPIFLAQDYFAS